MKTIIFFGLLSSCLAQAPALEVGDCVLGTNMGVWKLMNIEEKKFLFADYPVRKDSPVTVIEDISTFKEVRCP